MVFEIAFNQILENVQVNALVLAAAGDGVVSGLDVSERGAGVNMSVDVATGSAIINNTTYTESSVVNLAISAAHATHARKDIVIYDSATSNPLVVTGTPATPPIPPDITSGDILLAIVNVAANETTITNSEITDCIVEVPTASTIGGLLDVVISSVADKEILTYNSAGTNWINRTATEAGIAALSGFTMAGDINMGDYQINSIDDLKAHDVVGINIRRSDNIVAGQFGATGYFANAEGILHMGSYKITYLADPTSAQDAATKNWVENTAVIDADSVDGCSAGNANGTVFKIETSSTGAVYYKNSAGIGILLPSTNGYQLTTHTTGSAPTWSAASDLIFSDTHCPKCGQEFKDGDDLVLHVLAHNEVGDILTVPMHLVCANSPKKEVLVQRKVMEDQYTLNEATGELQVQRVQKTQEITVTRHKLKEGFMLNHKTGKAHELDANGAPIGTGHNIASATETIEETISESIYEEVEYRL